MTVHEQAAKGGWMNGTFKGEAVKLLEDHEVLNQYMKKLISEGYLDQWLNGPEFGILVVGKQ